MKKKRVAEEGEDQQLDPNQFATWVVATADTREAISMPSKLVTYIAASNGEFVARRAPFGVTYEKLGAKPPLLPSPMLPLHEGVSLNMPRLPWAWYTAIVAFFRHVAREHGTEALVRAYYNRARAAWCVVVPRQYVEPGGVRVDTQWSFDEPGEWIHACDVHSHVEMPAFFSTGDDRDERRAVRVYGVVGKVSSAIPESLWRVWTGTSFLAVGLSTVVEVPGVTLTAPVSASLGDVLAGRHRGRADQALESLALPAVAFPAEWSQNILTERQVVMDTVVMDTEEDALRARTRWWGLTGARRGKPTPDATAAVMAEARQLLANDTSVKHAYIVSADNKVLRMRPDGTILHTRMRPQDIADDAVVYRVPRTGGMLWPGP